MRQSLIALSSLVAMLAAAPAAAQSVIGQAAQAAPDVVGQIGVRRAAIQPGGAVHQNETIRTSAEGRAVLRFHDSTHLSVGPSATVKLDRFVYNRDDSARQAIINMTRGAFRFATGASDPEAFRLQTPHAVIGIRGTILEIVVSASATRVTLRQGAITVCARAGARSCVNLVAPGQSITIGDDRAALDPRGFGPRPGQRAGPDLTREGRMDGGGGDRSGGSRGN